MRKIALLFALLATALACLLPASPAQAQIRAFVAQTGNDANPCTFASPCKSAQHAHDVVAAGGEIRMLDPGGYGLLTITKSITIEGGGQGELATTAFTAAVTVNANASDKITIRGVVIEGFFSGQDGIRFNTGGSLSIQDCLIHLFTGNGIKFTPSASSTLAVSNTVISDNDTTGVFIQPGIGGNALAAFDRVDISNNRTRGLDVFGNINASVNVTISDSTVASNAQYGVGSTSSLGASAVMVKSSAIANNGIGLLAFAPAAILRVTRSTITGNTTGFSTQAGGTLVSLNDNTLEGNGTAGTATTTLGYH